MSCSMSQLRINYHPEAIVKLMAFVHELGNKNPNIKYYSIDSDI